MGVILSIVKELKRRGKRVIFDALTTPIEILDYQKTLELDSVKKREVLFKIHIS